jgi:pSer/pThr/pTyr-binding forkhead associated (FHA) protein
VGVLLVRSGPEAGMRLLLDKPVTSLGRHPDSDVFLDDITVSRRHAEIERTAHGYVARDAGSLNGTYLNQHRIDEASLTNGDELQVGKFRLVFQAGAADQP